MRQLTSWEALITSLLLVKNAWGFNNVNETLLHLIEQTGATGEPNRLKLLETLKYWAEKVEKGHRPCFCVGVSAVMADVRVFSDVTYLLKRVTSVVLSDDFVAVLWSMILTFERLQESQRRCCWEQRLSKLQTVTSSGFAENYSNMQIRIWNLHLPFIQVCFRKQDRGWV